MTNTRFGIPPAGKSRSQARTPRPLSRARALARLVPAALAQAASAHARTPGASRAHSRLASPAPLVLDSWCEDESPSSASDLFDRPASWFREEDGDEDFCDGCGEIIRPGQRLMPVRGCQDPANDRDLCAACTEAAYTPGPAETQFAMSNPIALAASATEPTLNMLQGLSLNETTDSEKTGPTNFAAYDDPLSAV
jgi:hypothetical protein